MVVINIKKWNEIVTLYNTLFISSVLLKSRNENVQFNIKIDTSA